MVDYVQITKRTVVIVFTTFLVALIIINSRGGTLSDLSAFEIIELFVAVPLAAVLYYWLIATKLESFRKNMDAVSSDLAGFYNKVEMFEKRFQSEEKDLKKEEVALKKEIASLTKESSHLAKDVKEMKNIIKQLDKRVKKLKK